MSTVARFRDAVEDGRRVLHFAGDLTLPRLGALPSRLDRLKGHGFLLDLSGVERMDTIGAWLVHRTARERDGEIVGANEDQQVLLRQVAEADKPVKVHPDEPPAIARVLGQVGAATAMAGRTMLGLVGSKVCLGRRAEVLNTAASRIHRRRGGRGRRTVRPTE